MLFLTFAYIYECLLDIVSGVVGVAGLIIKKARANAEPYG